MNFRKEKDIIGEKELPLDALYGIHSKRASDNFPHRNLFPIAWYKSIGLVKLSYFNTYKSFSKSANERYPDKLYIISQEIIQAMSHAAIEVSEGKHFDHFIVPGITGGAGTSINMNINEIIANVALDKLGKSLGDYKIIDPIEHANIYQSTNDVIPTSLKIAAMMELQKLESKINELRKKIEIIEKQHHNSVRTGYTQMQAAVPTTFGRLFATYNDALSRDWWRVSKCFERLKQVNIGGGAAGTSLTIPRYFVMNLTGELQRLTNLPIARSENLSDATANLDTLVEVHAIIKSHAVNLEKMVSDLRLLASDITEKLIEIPKKQAGSSIMPGKVNPVIPEYVISCAHKIYSNDALITSLSAQGCLELNAYIPIIGISFLESIELLIACNESIKDNLIDGMIVHSDKAIDNLYKNPSVATALIPLIGYHKAGSLAKKMKDDGISIYQANDILQIIEDEKLKEILKVSNLIKEGFSLKEL